MEASLHGARKRCGLRQERRDDLSRRRRAGRGRTGQRSEGKRGYESGIDWLFGNLVVVVPVMRHSDSAPRATPRAGGLVGHANTGYASLATS